jgi:hypothetical protein
LGHLAYGWHIYQLPARRFPWLTGRLSDHLRRKFGSGAVFMDVDGMKPGFDFVKQLDAQVSQCDAVLAIIGGNWLDARDDKGQRRLDTAHDYVRVELAASNWPRR